MSNLLFSMQCPHVCQRNKNLEQNIVTSTSMSSLRKSNDEEKSRAKWNVFWYGCLLCLQRSSSSSITGFLLKTPLSIFHFQFQSLQLFPNFFHFVCCKIWKQRMVQMGAVIEDRFSKRVTHVFAVDSHTLLHEFDGQRLSRFKGVRFFNF